MCLGHKTKMDSMPTSRTVPIFSSEESPCRLSGNPRYGIKKRSNQLFLLFLRHLPENCFLHQLAAAIEHEFLFDVGLVGLDRFDAEMEFIRNLTRAVAVAD